MSYDSYFVIHICINSVIVQPTDIVKIVTELDNDKVHEKAVVDCVTEHLIESVQQVDQHVSHNVAIM